MRTSLYLIDYSAKRRFRKEERAFLTEKNLDIAPSFSVCYTKIEILLKFRFLFLTSYKDFYALFYFGFF